MYQVSNPKAMEYQPRALFLCSAMKKCISSVDCLFILLVFKQVAAFSLLLQGFWPEKKEAVVLVDT
jgi:hypothetical protein